MPLAAPVYVRVIEQRAVAALRALYIDGTARLRDEFAFFARAFSHARSRP